MISIFPSSYTTFEIIRLARIIYFLLFNVINAVSITYVINDDKERTIKGAEMQRNQAMLTKLTEKIYKKINDGEPLSINSEITKKEYTDVKTKALKEMNLEMAALKQGKTKEELMKKEEDSKKKKFNWKSSLAIFVVIILSYRWY